jgi:hypothetical protein
MPKYMVLTSTFLHPNGEAGPRLVTVGEEIEFAGAPGAGRLGLNGLHRRRLESAEAMGA